MIRVKYTVFRNKLNYDKPTKTNCRMCMWRAATSNTNFFRLKCLSKLNCNPHIRTCLILLGKTGSYIWGIKWQIYASRFLNHNVLTCGFYCSCKSLKKYTRTTIKSLKSVELKSNARSNVLILKLQIFAILLIFLGLE